MGKSFKCRWCEDTGLYQPLTGPAVACSECKPETYTVTAPADVAAIAQILAPAGGPRAVIHQAAGTGPRPASMETLEVQTPSGRFLLPMTEEFWGHYMNDKVLTIDVNSGTGLAMPWIELCDTIAARCYDPTKPRFYPKGMRDRWAAENKGTFNSVFLPILNAPDVRGFQRGLLMSNGGGDMEIVIDKQPVSSLSWPTSGLRVQYGAGPRGEFTVHLNHWPTHERLVCDLVAAWNLDAPYGHINIQ